MYKRDFGFTLAQVRKGMWPAPVYEAHFGSGVVVRMSFWSKVGKPLDYGRGRAVCSKLCSMQDKRLINGWVELNGERTQDPMFALADEV